MWGGRKKCLVNFVLIWGICVLVPFVRALSDQRLCADPKCQTIISMGTGKINYNAGEKGMVSFKINAPIRIKSKSAGSNMELWGIEVNGREGYAPKNFILENRVFIKESNLNHIVPVVMPGSKAPQPELKASESSAEIKSEPELSTTAPLTASPIESSTQVPVMKATTVPASNEKLQEATPVQRKMEVVDGTQIPLGDDPNLALLDDSLDEEDDDEDGEIEDDDEDDEEELSEENKIEPPKPVEQPKKEEKQIEKEATTLNYSEPTKVEAQPLSANVPETNAEAAVEESAEKPAVKENSEQSPKPAEQPKEEEKQVEKKTTTLNNSEPTKVEAQPLSAKVLETNAEAAAKESTEKPAVMDNSEKEPTQTINLNKQAPSSNEQVEEPAEPEKEPVKLEKQTELENENIELTNEAIEYVENTKNATSESSTKSKEIKSDERNQIINENTQSDNIKDASNEAQSAETIETPKVLELKAHDGQYSEVINAPEDSINNTNETILVENEPTEMQSNSSVELNAQNQSSSETVTTIPPTTESGYHGANHADPYGLDVDTTTLPTVIAQDAVTPPPLPVQQTETQDSTGFDITTPSALNEPILPASVPTVPEEQAPPVIATTVPSIQPEVPKELELNMEPTAAPNKEENAAPQMPTLPPLFQQPTAAYQEQKQQPANQEGHQQPTQQSQNSNQANNEEMLQAQINDYYQQQAQDYQPTYPDHSLPSQPAIEPDERSIEAENVGQQTEFEEQPGVTENAGLGSIEPIMPQSPPSVPLPAMPLPSQTDVVPDVDAKENGLFATILGTVNNFINGKRDATPPSNEAADDELERILFPDRVIHKKTPESDNEYCEKLSPHECPKSASNAGVASATSSGDCHFDWAHLSLEKFMAVASVKVLEMIDMLAALAIAAATCLFFLFGYYCFCNSSREGALLSKLNALERSLLATQKENAILKQDLLNTRSKLSSIEDNSFGSNDMVMALKKELEEELIEKRSLQEQIATLEKELENAAEAGLELNKIVSELLSNQTGDESIISSVEELQMQLNEQQKTIMDINANLAEKSRENSELQLMLAEQNARLSGEIASLQQDNDELETDKSNLQTRLEDIKREFEEDITKALEGKNYEIKRLQSEIMELTVKCEAEHVKLQTSLAKVEALEECLRTVRRDPSVNISQVIDVAHVRAEMIDMQKSYASLKERLDIEADARRSAESHLEAANVEIEKLKQDFHQSEKDKLEAQTRLEVLSNYFKEKETQLQKELSLKEAMWLKQQGETTSTVDRLTSMQEEIQSLKSQNDALRAEIEAQLAAHKAQTGTLENRAHETWLAARQSERRYEEVRAEATALRRRLTALAGGAAAAGDPNFEKLTAPDLNNAPSPIHMESPGSPLLGRIPPPFLPPPFMGPPPPFMGMPPPFVPPGEMRPPPLGRLMSPPPGATSGGSGGSGHLPPPPPRGGRYSPGYDDYDDDEDDYDDEEEEVHRRRRRRSDVNGSWDREDSYSPPRTYRSHSPADSRYNYGSDREIISHYDSDTDFSPSMSKRRQRPRDDSYKDYSPPPNASSPINSGSRKTGATGKGHLSSGSDKSFNSPRSGKKSNKSAV